MAEEDELEGLDSVVKMLNGEAMELEVALEGASSNDDEDVSEGGIDDSDDESGF